MSQQTWNTPLKIKPVDPPQLEVIESWILTVFTIQDLIQKLEAVQPFEPHHRYAIQPSITLDNILSHILTSRHVGFQAKVRLSAHIVGRSLDDHQFNDTDPEGISSFYLVNRFGIVPRTKTLRTSTRILNLREGDQQNINGFLLLDAHQRVVYTIYNDELEGEYPAVTLVHVPTIVLENK